MPLKRFHLTGQIEQKQKNVLRSSECQLSVQGPQEDYTQIERKEAHTRETDGGCPMQKNKPAQTKNGTSKEERVNVLVLDHHQHRWHSGP